MWKAYLNISLVLFKYRVVTCKPKQLLEHFFHLLHNVYNQFLYVF
jgi:hypothetical protein